MDVKITSENVRGYRKHMERNDRPYSESRVFLSFGETVLEHLQNRRSRPYNELKPLVLAALRERGIPVEKLRWNRYAGCSMCACSGGFMVEGEYGKDYYAEVAA